MSDAPSAPRNGSRRILVYECCPLDGASVVPLLDREGCEVIPCQSAEELLERVMTERPSAVVAALKQECRGDLAVLHLVRRTAPAMPLILLASDSSLDVERMARQLQPFYYSVAPVEREEIRAAVEAALERDKHPSRG